jgi:hypothetical protein
VTASETTTFATTSLHEIKRLGVLTLQRTGDLVFYQLHAEEKVALPADAFVIGEPVSAVAITYSGHPRAGLTCPAFAGSDRSR